MRMVRTNPWAFCIVILWCNISDKIFQWLNECLINLEESTDIEKENTVPQFPPLTTLRTKDGLCKWDDLHLTPAPPKYRPFERMAEEEKLKSQSKNRSRSKGRLQILDYNQIIKIEIFKQDKGLSSKQRSLSEKMGVYNQIIKIDICKWENGGL